ncbi:MAG TPA: transporter [Gemmatimonadaceae bacterium]|nr:transporter [Gemmatimonadaceae bacterium]
MILPRCGIAALASATLSLQPFALEAQGLRDKFSQLFVFGPGGLELFLPGSADPSNPAGLQVHGRHFIPSAVDANGSLISFISSAISTAAANAPSSAASSGTTFHFEGGVPVPTSASSGPVFGERGPTLGRGRVFVGFNNNHAHFASIRGVDMHDIEFVFTHQNVTNATLPGCDSIAGGDCRLMGIPKFENDVMNFRMALDVDVTVRTFGLAYGLTDRLDLSFELPIVSVDLSGTSFAQIVPFGGPPVAHFFGGTPTNPVLSASQAVTGHATGLGDVAARLKYNVSQSERTAFSLLVDARFATGSTDDLLGAGYFSARGLAIISARFGAFTPHANVGYAARGGPLRNDAVLATLGFDHLMAPWATFSADLLSEFQVGANKLKLPGVVTYDAPFRRTVLPTTIPNIRDDLINGSVGVKFRTFGDLTAVTNVIVPLNRAGLRPNVFYTFGLEYGF